MGHQAFRRFQRQARRFGISLSDAQIDQFQTYYTLLTEWNRTVRLVASDRLETVLWHHFMDSLTPCIHLLDVEELLDIGAGAGFPGLPIKIALPHIRLHLVESRRRRAHFLRHVIRSLELQTSWVYRVRLGQQPLPDRYQAVIARAVAPPAVWLPLAKDCVRECGRIVALLGPSVDATEYDALLKQHGLRVEYLQRVELPLIKHQRVVMILKKNECFT
jgi:16S rRNA (guanine527-N7)-methyltransferase